MENSHGCGFNVEYVSPNPWERDGEAGFLEMDGLGVDKTRDQNIIGYLLMYVGGLCTQPTGHTKTFTFRWMERPPSTSDAQEGDALAAGYTDYCVVESTGVDKQIKDDCEEQLKRLVRAQGPQPVGHTRIIRIRWGAILGSDPLDVDLASGEDGARFQRLLIRPTNLTVSGGPPPTKGNNTVALLQGLNRPPVLQMPPRVPPPPEPRV